MAGNYETERQRVIREEGLTKDEVVRADTRRAGDPISDYAGNFALQGSMLVEARTEIPSNITLGSE